MNLRTEMSAAEPASIYFNLLNPKSDQHVISPYNITLISHVKVMRRNLLIGKQILLVSALGNV